MDYLLLTCLALAVLLAINLLTSLFAATPSRSWRLGVSVRGYLSPSVLFESLGPKELLAALEHDAGHLAAKYRAILGYTPE